MPRAHDYARTHADAFRDQLRALLRIPSISTLPERASEVAQAAEWVAQNMREAGIEHVAVLPTARHPVAYGDWLHAGPGSPTVLIYGHYDVQPAEVADGWDNDPFDPVERDGKLYARGASDDKGQMFVHIKAVESMLRSEGTLPVNVKFLIEGEEEIGSPNLVSFLEANRELLRADVCVISDTGIVSIDQPSIIYALRGLVALEVIVQGPARDLHSGIYGGAVHNPVQALAEIVAHLHHDDGSVAVPGFYEDVLPLEAEERAELRKTAWSDADLIGMTGVPAPWGEADYTIRERVGARPTLEINGMAGGFYGDGIKTVLPARALAKITCRLVANQRPDRIAELITAYVAQITPATVLSQVRVLPGNSVPALVDIRTPAMRAAISAYEKGWGSPPVFMREGGSIPIVVDFQRELNLPVILMGFGLSTDGAHGPNEHFVIEMFHKGIDTMIHFFHDVAQHDLKGTP
jgi:acetylornithine deacetylase/succinyl-diaminopimelate desuccinylase-like protein